MIGRLIAWLSQLLATLIPTAIKEWRRPRKTEYTGTDDEIDEAIAHDIRDTIRGDPDDNGTRIL